MTQLMLYPADNLSTSSSHYYGGWRESRAEITLSTRIAPGSIEVNCECSEKNNVLLWGDGAYQCFSFQICEVGGLAIIHKSTHSNLATHKKVEKFRNHAICLLLHYNLLSKYGDFLKTFLISVGQFFSKISLCTCFKGLLSLSRL